MDKLDGDKAINRTSLDSFSSDLDLAVRAHPSDAVAAVTAATAVTVSRRQHGAVVTAGGRQLAQRARAAAVARLQRRALLCQVTWIAT